MSVVWRLLFDRVIDGSLDRTLNPSSMSCRRFASLCSSAKNSLNGSLIYHREDSKLPEAPLRNIKPDGVKGTRRKWKLLDRKGNLIWRKIQSHCQVQEAVSFSWEGKVILYSFHSEIPQARLSYVWIGLWSVFFWPAHKSLLNQNGIFLSSSQGCTLIFVLRERVIRNFVPIR